MALRYSLDLERLARAYETRELTPREVVCDVLTDIERTRGGDAAWIHLVSRGALIDRAVALEQRHAAGERFALYGVPFAVKDNIDLAGEPTTAACPAYRYLPDETAYAVQRLEEAGAICIGKTNMDQFATGLVGTRSPYGACANPFDARYICGGSSSGSALAVARGQVSFALGTDTAGSGRVPAAFCNVVGLKPTRGLVSTRGVVAACRSLDCVSVFATTCEDAAAVLEVLAAHDPADAFSRNERPRAARAFDASLRCGVPRRSDLRFFGDALAERAFERTLATLQSLGASLVEIDYAPYVQTARLLYEGPWVAERLAAIAPFYRASAKHIVPVVRKVIAGAEAYSAVDAYEGYYRLQALKRACEAQWKDIDLLVVPTAGTIYRLEEIATDPIALNANLGYYTNFVNLLDLAAIAVPGHFRDDGLPAGVTLIARALEEERLARWGARLHRAAATRLGATVFPLPPEKPARDHAPEDSVILAVVGAHLTGMPLNSRLTSRGARFVATSATAPLYRLYDLPGSLPPRPGLIRVRNGRGAAIALELWRVPLGRFGALVAEIAPPLAIGTIVLSDGREVKGFVCESHALEHARDISEFGGWREFVTRREPEEHSTGKTPTS